ncbi:hypothetical protein Syun_011003 [Stephania yunnanensis]|uniref:Uncharacterized protein n=1 Tax=Stephania yunnanensis TaxID=152371 RepID=A0AAP0JY11_9MAGN
MAAITSVVLLSASLWSGRRFDDVNARVYEGVACVSAVRLREGDGDDDDDGAAPPPLPPHAPANFWGDAPEEEYYTSQGVRNTKSYFETPHGRLFTQSFTPLNLPVKATVYMTHGYGSDTGWLFQKICISYATWGTQSTPLISSATADPTASAATSAISRKSGQLSLFLPERADHRIAPPPPRLFIR